MWTASNKRYYDVIRSHEAASRAEASPTVRSRSSGSGTITTLPAAGFAEKSRAKLPPATIASTARYWVESSEELLGEPIKVLDPVAVLHLDRAAVCATTHLSFNHRGVTDLHENLLLFENLDTLSLNGNRLTRVCHLLPPERRPLLLRQQGPSRTSASTKVTAAADSAAVTATDGFFSTGSAERSRDCVDEHIERSDNTALLRSMSSTAHAGPTRSMGTSVTTQLTAPRGCVRLRRLLVAGNRLRQLDSAHTDVSRLTHLEYLNAAGNKLSDLGAVVAALRPLRQLVYLDLTGNPICEDPTYRRKVVSSLPQLEVLDRMAVTAQERRAAAAADRQTLGKALGTTVATSPATAAHEAVRVGGHNKSSRRALWAKSASVKQMEQRYALHLRETEARAAAEAAEAAATARVAADTRAGFHAVWELARTATPTKDTDPTSTATTIATSTPATHVSLPSIDKHAVVSSPTYHVPLAHESVMYDALLGRADLMNQKALRAAVGQEWIPVGVPPPERLAALKEAIMEANRVKNRVATTGSAATGENADTVASTTAPAAAAGGGRGATGQQKHGISRGGSTGAPCGGTAVTASLLLPPRTSRSGTEERETATVSVAASRAAQMAALKTHAHACIPPPWEGLGAVPASALETAAAATGVSTLHPGTTRHVQAVTERLDAVVEAVAVLFLPEELQSVEARFGACELLRAVRSCHAGGVGSGLVSAGGGSGSGGALSGAAGSTSAGRRSGAGGKRPSSTHSGRKAARGGTAAAVAMAAAAEADSTRDALWAAITSAASAALLSAVTACVAGQAFTSPSGTLSSSSYNTGIVSSASTNNAAAPHAVNVSAATGSGGIIGPFTAAALYGFCSELAERTGAWGLDMSPLLAVLQAAYGVDPMTGKLIAGPPALQKEQGDGGGRGSAEDGTTAVVAAAATASSAGRASRGGGNGGSANGRQAAAANARSRKSGSSNGGGGGSSHHDSGDGVDTLGGDGGNSRGTSPVGSGGCFWPTGTAILTVNHVLSALVYYEPFVAARAQFFAECCATATRAAVRSGPVTASTVNPRTILAAAAANNVGSGEATAVRARGFDGTDSDDGTDSAEEGAGTAEERKARGWFSREQRARVLHGALLAAQARGIHCGPPNFDVPASPTDPIQ